MSDFQVAAVFSDHCVLQRNKNIKVFGYSSDSVERRGHVPVQAFRMALSQ